MDIATTSAIERIGRVLAGRRISSNAKGSEVHAASEIDARWRDFSDDAIAILKSLREPDAGMERAGDVAIWQRMIDAALGVAADGSNVTPVHDSAPAEPPPPGTNPLHEGP